MGLSRRDDLVLLDGLRRTFAQRRNEQAVGAVESLIADIEQEIANDPPTRAAEPREEPGAERPSGSGS
jgi:hypothetical protein